MAGPGLDRHYRRESLRLRHFLSGSDLPGSQFHVPRLRSADDFVLLPALAPREDRGARTLREEITVGAVYDRAYFLESTKYARS